MQCIDNKLTELLDNKLPGFSIRMTPTGVKSFNFRFPKKIYGSKRVNIGRYPNISLADARSIAKRYILDVANRRDLKDILNTKEQSGTTISQAMDLYFSDKRVKLLRTIKEQRRVLAKDLFFGILDSDIAELSKIDALERLDKIEVRSPSLARAAHSYANSMFKYLIETGIISKNPVSQFRLAQRPQSRVRVLTDRELSAVWNATFLMKYPHGHFVRLLILTGKRRNEIAGMRWSEIDYEEKRIIIGAQRMKSKRTHSVPLTERVETELRSIIIIDPVFVFPTNTRVVKSMTHFHSIKREIDSLIPKMPRWTFHDLRRTFITFAIKHRTNLAVIDTIIDHSLEHILKSKTPYARYDYSEEMQQHFNLWAKHLDSFEKRTTTK